MHNAYDVWSLYAPSAMMKENGGRTRWTRSQAEPEWSEAESLILLNEIAEVEADIPRQLWSFDRWRIIAENCAALDVGRNFSKCRRKWRALLSDYNHVVRRSSLSPELFGAIERVVKGRQERGQLDLDFDAVPANEATVKIGSRRKRQLHLEEFLVEDYLAKTYKLKCALKRRRKQIEMQKSLAKVELDENHGIEKPKLTKVGDITNSREENEEMLMLKLQELAIEIQAINAELADTTMSQNIEDYTEFTRRQGYKIKQRPEDQRGCLDERPEESHQEKYLKSIQEKKEEKYLKDFLEKRYKLKFAEKRCRKHIEMPLRSLAKVELDENHDIEKPKLTSVGNITNSREENEEMLTRKLQELEIQVRGCLEHGREERPHF